MTFDRRTIDSTGSFLIGELERLDQKLHDPLVAVTWSRDIDLRSDVTIADEVSSFTNSSFAAVGGVSARRQVLDRQGRQRHRRHPAGHRQDGQPADPLGHGAEATPSRSWSRR
jgi:hypothetical protein